MLCYITYFSQTNLTLFPNKLWSKLNNLIVSQCCNIDSFMLTIHQRSQKLKSSVETNERIILLDRLFYVFCSRCLNNYSGKLLTRNIPQVPIVGSILPLEFVRYKRFTFKVSYSPPKLTRYYFCLLYTSRCV